MESLERILALRFYNDVKYQRPAVFMDFNWPWKIFIETYSLLIDTYVDDPLQKDKLFNAINYLPCVQKKAHWTIKWIGSRASFAERLVAFAAIGESFLWKFLCHFLA